MTWIFPLISVMVLALVLWTSSRAGDEGTGATPQPSTTISVALSGATATGSTAAAERPRVERGPIATGPLIDSHLLGRARPPLPPAPSGPSGGGVAPPPLPPNTFPSDDSSEGTPPIVLGATRALP